MIKRIKRKIIDYKLQTLTFLLKILSLLSSYVFMVLVTNIYGIDEWGRFSIVFGFFMILSVIGTFGLDVALLKQYSQFIALGKKKESITVFQMTQVLGLLISILLFAFTICFKSFISNSIFHKPYLESDLLIISFGIIPLVLVSIQSERFRAIRKPLTYLLFKEVYRFWFPIIFITIFYFLNISNNIFVLLVISFYLIFLLSIIQNRKIILDNQGIHLYNYSIIKNILMLALPLIFANSSLIIRQWISTLVLGVYVNDFNVGYFNILLKISTLIGIPLFVINIFFAPKFARSNALNNLNQLKSDLKNTSKISAMYSSLIFIIILIFSKVIFGMLKIKWSSDAFFLLIILGLAPLLNSLWGSVGYFLQMTGNEKQFLNITVIVSLLTIIFNLFLIPIFGIWGAAISTLASSIIWGVLNILFIYKKHKIISIALIK